MGELSPSCGSGHFASGRGGVDIHDRMLIHFPLLAKLRFEMFLFFIFEQTNETMATNNNSLLVCENNESNESLV